MNRRVVISGCSGGGKSTLLETLRKRGYTVVEEPGRRIVREELASGGQALPWTDMAAFARRAVSLAIADWQATAPHENWVFFDRSLIDAASALDDATGERNLHELGETYRYHRQVFLAPPWPEIYGQDSERQHDFDSACREFRRLSADYPSLAYEVVELPEVSVSARADHVLRCLNRRQQSEPTGSAAP